MKTVEEMKAVYDRGNDSKKNKVMILQIKNNEKIEIVQFYNLVDGKQ